MINRYHLKNWTMIMALFSFLMLGCKKYLDTVPDQSLVIPSSLQDFQALLDENGVINLYTCGLGEASADNYYVTYSTWAGLDNGSKSTYTWGNELFYGNTNTTNNEWYTSYRAIYYANTIIEGLKKISKTEANETEWNHLEGSALFIRAYYFHVLVTVFAKSYDSLSAATDLGIPLRLTPDFNKTYLRASVEQSYDQIISDLSIATSLLSSTSLYVTRPSRTAAYGLLARVYLSMRDYKKAGVYADSCLTLDNTLMDYNGGSGINGAAALFPFANFNPETIFFATGGQSLLDNDVAEIDSNLYRSYETNDLRLTLFYNKNDDGSYSFKGNYDENGVPFVGIATDEIYLIKAECLVREGEVTNAMATLNDLMVKRWETGTFVPFTAVDANDALNKILAERRKELLMRDVRWMDIKRLNKEGANIVLKRILNGETYQLTPNSNKYALPLPSDIIRLTGMKQNPR